MHERIRALLLSRWCYTIFYFWIYRNKQNISNEFKTKMQSYFNFRPGLDHWELRYGLDWGSQVDLVLLVVWGVVPISTSFKNRLHRRCFPRLKIHLRVFRCVLVETVPLVHLNRTTQGDSIVSSVLIFFGFLGLVLYVSCTYVSWLNLHWPLLRSSYRVWNCRPNV